MLGTGHGDLRLMYGCSRASHSICSSFLGRLYTCARVLNTFGQCVQSPCVSRHTQHVHFILTKIKVRLIWNAKKEWNRPGFIFIVPLLCSCMFHSYMNCIWWSAVESKCCWGQSFTLLLYTYPQTTLLCKKNGLSPEYNGFYWWFCPGPESRFNPYREYLVSQ